MQDLTRAELLQNTPERYLIAGYLTDLGAPRPALSSVLATAACTQLLAAELAPQELAFTAEAIRQLLPPIEGTPAARLACAITRMRSSIPRTTGQPGNAGLVAWLDDCSAAVVTAPDLGAFLSHLLAVQRQYGLMVKISAVHLLTL